MNLSIQHTVINTLTTWEGVTSAPHRFGGIEFNLGTTEIGHIHRANGMVDILFSRALREQLVNENQTGLHHLLPETGWTTTFLRTETDIERIVWLFRVSYLQKRYRKASQTDELATQLATLGVSPALHALLTRSANTDTPETDA
jgi:Family of unknown function (DUF5519)